MKTKQVIISKFSPPVIKNPVRRERLFTLFDNKSPARSLWISGPAGSGKTTFVASYLKEKNLPYLWYQIDAIDETPADFFHYLDLAAAPLLEPAVSPMPLLKGELAKYPAHLDNFALHYFETFYRQVRPGSWLIFDNFQDAPKKSSLLQVLASAINQLPEDIVIAILSRNDFPPVFSRFIANRTMKTIGRNQIKFSSEEFDAFLAKTGRIINETHSRQLYQATNGWIAGAILWLLDAESDGETEPFSTDYTPQNIFDYFTTEILNTTGTQTQNFLLQTSLLPHITPIAASELTGMKAEDCLNILSRKNFFIERNQTNNCYDYHPLFRQFLQTSISRIYSAALRRKIFYRAAQIIDGHGWLEEAIDLYLKAEAFDSSASGILNLAPSLIFQGHYTRLSSWIDALPERFCKENPWLLFWKGSAYTIQKPLQAQFLCSMAYRLFVIRHDLPGQVLSWATSVELFFILRSGFTELDYWIQEGERLGQQLSGEKDPDLYGHFASNMLMALLLRDQGHPDMEKWQNQCEALLMHCNDLQVRVSLMKNLFWSYHWLGQVHKSQVTEAKLQILQNTDNLPPMVQIILNGFFILSSVIAGNHRLCLSKTTTTLALAEKNGIHVYDFMMFACCAYTMMGTGNMSQVQEILEKMRKALTPAAVWDQGHYHFLNAWFTMQEGDLIKAKSEMTKASILIESCGNPFTIALSRVLHSQLLLALGKEDEVETILASVMNDRRLGKSRLIDFITKLSLADCACAGNCVEEEKRNLQEAFAIAREHGLSMPFALCNKRLGILCKKALDAEIETQTVIEFIRHRHLQAPDPRTASDRWPWPIRIYTLGRFSINTIDKPLECSGKPSRKPLELLTFLISVGQKGAFRQVIAGRLWQDSDGDRAIQNLNTTLYRLRKILGSDEAVTLKNGQLKLNPQFCWIDCQHFEWLAHEIDNTASSLTLVECIEKAFDLYRGPYTTGYENISVAISYGEQLKKLWFRVLAAALPIFVEKQLTFRDLLEKALAEDDTAASVFSYLLNVSSKEKRGVEAISIIHQCQNLLTDQGILFGNKTKALLSKFEK
ncbi:MAG: hypothetical protein WBB23_01805 [Desulforhopalus sp.]